MAQNLQSSATPARHRLDVTAYYKMAAVGILTPKDRVELIDGEIIDMNPIGTAHAGMVNRLNLAFARAALEGKVLPCIQNPLRLDAYNEPEPDLMLLRPRADHYQLSHPNAADVLLLIEVSDSSLAYDQATKLPLYARFGIPEVWIFDLAARAVEFHRQPNESGYAVQGRTATGLLIPILISSLEIDIGALLT